MVPWLAKVYVTGKSMASNIELTEVSALWLLKRTLVNGSEVPEMSLGAKSLWTKRQQNCSVH